MKYGIEVLNATTMVCIHEIPAGSQLLEFVIVTERVNHLKHVVRSRNGNYLTRQLLDLSILEYQQ